jgi:glycosyltransferase involved in cell wall biosynthesis
VRVLHLTDRLDDRGGAARHLLSIARAQAGRGHEVHVAAGQDHLLEEVPATRHRWAGLESRVAAPIDLDARLGRLRPDVIHVHTVMNPVALAGAAAAGALFTVQDHRSVCPARGKWTARGAVCRTSFSAAACAECFDDHAYHQEMVGLTRARLDALRGSGVVVLSEYMRGELLAAGLEPGLVHVVPPFVDFPPAEAGGEPTTTPSGPPCVLFVGRLTAAKGPLDAVEAWRRSSVALPLVVAGTGPLREAVEKAGAEVLGWVAHHALPALLRRARALLLPSRWQEPFGIAGLEALAFGVPVVAWDSGGVREWHPGPLVAWGDVDGLAGELRRAVDGGAVRPLARERFDQAALMDRLDRVYRTAPSRAVPA